jgi:hypothetical protein
MDAFTEDWNASQFWYSDETATVLARQLLADASDDTRIAVVSAPSAFIQIKNLLVSHSSLQKHTKQSLMNPNRLLANSSASQRSHY